MDWRRTHVSADGTHHTVDGRPLYPARFLEVLKFHAPGLAPVVDEDGAFHVDLSGNAAYAERHHRTFGFYEGLAAVDSRGGWFHIDIRGSRAYSASWDWCGNLQGGRCAVRRDGRYLHIDPEGRPIHDSTWRYVGDFRDGIAVVQGDDGLHTHIDSAGELLHGRWFVDLDVFHKGFARARDERGWTHVDGLGRPVYEARFAGVEPFYNGQARVERFDGGLDVIDKAGTPVVQLRPPQRSEFAALSGDLVGFWRTRTIAAAVTAGVFEALPGDPSEIGRACGLRPERVLRLLRALAELDLVRASASAWIVTSRGAYLRADHPWTLADAAQEYDGPMDGLWRRLPEILVGAEPRTGIFTEVAADPPRARTHHRMLSSYARHDYADVPAALQLRGDEAVLDCGGGTGVLGELLLKRHPSLQVTILDLPGVLTANPSPDGLTAHPADFFADWGLSSDVVLLARVLHDWPDEDALRILARARGALSSGGRIFVVELLRAEDGHAGALCDLHLLAVTGGGERTRAEYEGLLDASGFEAVAVRETGSVVSVLEARAR